MFTGGFEFIFVLFIAFLLFGPKKLPEIARVLGKGLNELRRASSDLKFSLEEEIRNLDRENSHNASALPPYTYAHQDQILEAETTQDPAPAKVETESTAPSGDLTGTVTNNGHDHRATALREPDSPS